MPELSVLITQSVGASECGTCLIYRVYQYLRVLQREATSRFFLILARKNGLDQGGALKGVSNQTSAGYIVAVKKVGSGVIGIADDTMLAKVRGHTTLG